MQTFTAQRILCSLRRPCTRSFAAASGGSGAVNPYTVGPFQVFDRNAKRIQKDRAAARDGGERSRTVDYVRDEVADRLVERFLVSLSIRYARIEILILKPRRISNVLLPP